MSATRSISETAFNKPRPEGATASSPPEGVLAPRGSAYGGVAPKTAELAVLPDVVRELNRFADYVGVFGKTAPPLALVAQTFDAGAKWSAMRANASAWEQYYRAQEAMAWEDIRKLTVRLQHAFKLATEGDATIGTDNPALARFFGTATIRAQKAAVTRKANEKLIQEGKLPTKGGVGKRRKRAAADQLLAEKLAAASEPHR